MIHSLINTAIVLDSRRQKQDGTFPVKLRVTYSRKQKYYGTGYSLTEEDFEKVMGGRPRGTYKETRLLFNEVEEKAWGIIKDLSSFTFPAFEKHLKSKRGERNNAFAAIQMYVDKLDDEGRAGTASSYRNCLSSLRKYVNRKQLPFEEVTVGFLKAYEQWMLDQDNSLTTVGIYLRSLRAIYNEAISEGVISQDHYPFGKRKYQIPAGRNIKKALSLAEIEKIFTYPVKEESTEAFARDIWIFSYLCNGINLKDIARLKYKNLDEEKVVFIRAKTERTSRKNLKPVVASLHPRAKEIIDRWGNQPANPDDFVFPILTPGLSPQQELAKVRQANKTINKYLKRIAMAVGIEKPVTTYSARHSFSTVLKRSGAPLAFISESLGHSDLKTTESYLDSFEDGMRKEWAERLVDFGG